MKKNLFVCFSLLIQFSYCQITNSDVAELRKIPKTYNLNIYNQKQINGKFINDKHTKYVLKIEKDKIASQKIYDTLYHKVAYNKILNYKYDKIGRLKTVKTTNFNNALKETILSDYQKENLVLKTTTNEYNDTIQQIKYQYTKCKSSYIKDNIEDDEINDIENLFKCEYEITHNKISNYKFTTVKVYKIGTGLIKKITLQSDENSPIQRVYSYNYDENFNLRSIDLIKEDVIKTYTSFQYNKNNDVIKVKQGYSVLFYTYKYDEFNNWIEKTETSKNKKKRRIFKQIFTY